MADIQLEEKIAETVARLPRPAVDVRPARYEDVNGIRTTLQRALEETETPLPPPDEPYVFQATMDLIAQELVAVAEVEGRIVGVIMLDHGRWPWTHPNNPAGVHLYNQHFWVDPANRKGGVAARLLSFAKRRGNELKLPVMIEIGCADSNNELKDRFVKSSGFRYIGGKFYRANQGDE